jgi:hypothetical protein
LFILQTTKWNFKVLVSQRYIKTNNYHSEIKLSFAKFEPYFYSLILDCRLFGIEPLSAPPVSYYLFVTVLPSQIVFGSQSSNIIPGGWQPEI